MTFRSTLACAALLAALASPAAAQIADNTRGVGMGGAVRGDPLGASALRYNPAGMSRAYLYTAEAQYFRGGPGDINAVGLAIVDSKTQPALAVGASYDYEFTDQGAENEVSGHDIRLGFANALVPKRVHAGVALEYLTIDRGALGDLTGFTLDAGLLFTLAPAFHLGLVGHDLINLDDAARPRRAGGGVAYTGAFLTADVDVLADFDTQSSVRPVVNAGLELLLAEAVPVRAGFEWNDARDERWVGGGIGFISSGQGATSSQVGVSYRQNIDDAKNLVFAAGLTMFL